MGHARKPPRTTVRLRMKLTPANAGLALHGVRVEVLVTVFTGSPQRLRDRDVERAAGNRPQLFAFDSGSTQAWPAGKSTPERAEQFQLRVPASAPKRYPLLRSGAVGVAELLDCCSGDETTTIHRGECGHSAYCSMPRCGPRPGGAAPHRPSLRFQPCLGGLVARRPSPELEKLGWSEGRNLVVLEPLMAEGVNERLPALAAEFVA